MNPGEHVRDLAPELALGTLDGNQRALVMAHVAECPACRDDVAGLTEIVDLLTQATPAVTPSPGFEARVQAAMASSETATSALPLRLAPVRAPQPRRPAWWMLIAAALIAAAITGVVVRRLSAEPDRLVASAAMIGAGGKNVGSAYVLSSSPKFVVVTVSYSLRGDAYNLQGIGAGGRVVELGALDWTGGQWHWSGALHAADADLTTFRVVSPSGDIFCEGHLSS